MGRESKRYAATIRRQEAGAGKAVEGEGRGGEVGGRSEGGWSGGGRVVAGGR